MSFYSSPQLSSGQSWFSVFGDTWSSYNIAAGWSNNTDNTATVTMYITLDCGTTWISVDTNAVSWPLGQFTLVTNNNNLFPPINGMKFTVTNAAAGNTLAVIVTGTG